MRSTSDNFVNHPEYGIGKIQSRWGDYAYVNFISQFDPNRGGFPQTKVDPAELVVQADQQAASKEFETIASKLFADRRTKLRMELQAAINSTTVDTIVAVLEALPIDRALTVGGVADHWAADSNLNRQHDVEPKHIARKLKEAVESGRVEEFRNSTWPGRRAGGHVDAAKVYAVAGRADQVRADRQASKDRTSENAHRAARTIQIMTELTGVTATTLKEGERTNIVMTQASLEALLRHVTIQDVRSADEVAGWLAGSGRSEVKA